MAQRKGAEPKRAAAGTRRRTRAPRWARRLGLEPKGAVAVAAAVVLCAVGAVGAWRLVTPSEVVVERGSQSEATETVADGATAGDETSAPEQARDRTSEAAAEPEPSTTASVQVHVDGAVASPVADGATAGDETSAPEQARDRTSEAAAEPEPSTTASVQVHVDGAVASPGLYVLEGEDLRVNDAVAAAGGLTADADTSVVNLAEPISDGCKVHVPVAGEAPATTQGTTAATSTSSPASVALVNINTAGVDDFCTLSGVGEATAKAIIEEREANGPFASKEDLMRVSGIGEKKYAKVEADICV